MKKKKFFGGSLRNPFIQGSMVIYAWMLSKDVVSAVLSLLSEMSPLIGRHSAVQPKVKGLNLWPNKI